MPNLFAVGQTVIIIVIIVKFLQRVLHLTRVTRNTGRRRITSVSEVVK